MLVHSVVRATGASTSRYYHTFWLSRRAEALCTPGLGIGAGLGLIVGVTVTSGEGGGIRGSNGLGLGMMVGGLGSACEGNGTLAAERFHM